MKSIKRRLAGPGPFRRWPEPGQIKRGKLHLSFKASPSTLAQRRKKTWNENQVKKEKADEENSFPHGDLESD